MMHVYIYHYFIVNPCIYICIWLFTFYIYVSSRFLCVYILIACSSKNLCGIAQLDTGYVTVCSVERMKEFYGIAWPGMDGWGRYISYPGFLVKVGWFDFLKLSLKMVHLFPFSSYGCFVFCWWCTFGRAVPFFSFRTRIFGGPFTDLFFLIIFLRYLLCYYATQ
jgi:hypothetical protein